MADSLPVELVFEGRPFDAAAVTHTLRHLAMHVGWRLVPRSQYRLVYATFAGALSDATSGPLFDGIVVPSSPQVGAHLREARTPFPLARDSDGQLVPFPHVHRSRRGWLDGDVVAGAHACLNLWYEQRTQPAAGDGWILYKQDWMAQAGLSDPAALADRWLKMIYETSLQLGWPDTRQHRQFTVVLTHDVDYLPGRRDRGSPRFARTLYRQLLVRRRPLDAWRLLRHYLRESVRSRTPYLEVSRIIAEEGRLGARSSFQFVVDPQHRHDPRYTDRDIPWSALRPEWEVCLHGSYLAARTPGKVKAERARLEALAQRAVCGYRQHYLNFQPERLFREVVAAGLRYDMSVGYNDRSGPRAGTHFPFKPFDLSTGQPYGFWEIPFVLMDTTLATTYRLSGAEALLHARAVLEPVVAGGGCVAIIWHQEQCGGLLDPGYDATYLHLLRWLVSKGGQLITGAQCVDEWDAAWQGTAGDD